MDKLLDKLIVINRKLLILIYKLVGMQDTKVR